jgi:hypothetical protein
MTLQTKITATAGGGQANGFPLTKEYNIVQTVAKADDSVLLPESAPGKRVWLFNTGENALNVFTLAGGTIDGQAVNEAKALKPASMVILEGTQKENVWKSIV